MNRAFVNEDADSGVVFIPPRAPLPQGVVNYVTPGGYRKLKEELAGLEKEKERIQDDRKMPDQEKVRLFTIARGRYKDLEARIMSAKVVEPGTQPAGQIRFGATVKLHGDVEHKFTIVGVDEADVAKSQISFVSPIARAVIGKVTGDMVLLPSPTGPKTFEIVGISYG